VNIDKARKRLEARRRDLEQVVRAADEQASSDEAQAATGGEAAGIDTHTADAAADTIEREMAFSVKEATEGHLRDVDRALHRLEEGSYGRCQVCNTAIPDGRLEAKPEAEYCVEHEPPAVATEGAA